MRVTDFGNCGWKKEDFAKEAAESNPSVDSKIALLVSSISNKIFAFNQIASRLSIPVMDAVESTAKEKGYCTKAEPFFKNATSLEKKLLLKVSDAVAEKYPAMEKTHILGICILFGIEEIHNIVSSLANATATVLPETERKTTSESTDPAIASLKAYIEKYDGGSLTPGMRQFLAQAKLAVALAEGQKPAP